MGPWKGCIFGEWEPEMQQVYQRYWELLKEAYAPRGIVVWSPNPEYMKPHGEALKTALNEIVPDKKRQRDLYNMHAAKTDHMEEEQFLYRILGVLLEDQSPPNHIPSTWTYARPTIETVEEINKVAPGTFRR